jgi:hypothetical protein
MVCDTCGVWEPSYDPEGAQRSGADDALPAPHGWYERELRFIAGVKGSRPQRPATRHLVIGLALILAVFALAIAMS